MNLTTIQHCGHRLAYVHTRAAPDARTSSPVTEKKPSVIFCGGFKSSMDGLKARALEAHCVDHGFDFTRFDYSGHGSSEGNFEEGDIGRWLSDALCVFDHIEHETEQQGTNSPGFIVIGSSMGAWIATLLCKQRKTSVAGLITIAAAPDFTEQLLLPALSDEQCRELNQGNTIYLPSDYDDGSPYPISANLIQQSRKHCILDAPFELNVPVRLLHGTGDKDVPHQMSVSLMELIQSDDIALTLIKNADHRLSSASELKMITRTVDDMADTVSNQASV